jgi:hypothetical protein
MLYITIVVQMFLVFQCHLWPWRTTELNMLDGIVSCALLGMTVSSGPLLASPDRELTDQISTWVMVFVSIAVFSVMLVLCRNAVQSVKNSISPAAVKDEQDNRRETLSRLAKKSQVMWRALSTLSEDEVSAHLAHLGPLDLQDFKKHVVFALAEWLEMENDQATKEILGDKALVKLYKDVHAPASTVSLSMMRATVPRTMPASHGGESKTTTDEQTSIEVQPSRFSEYSTATKARHSTLEDAYRARVGSSS